MKESDLMCYTINILTCISICIVNNHSTLIFSLVSKDVLAGREEWYTRHARKYEYPSITRGSVANLSMRL